jgi:hypothetical protein
MVLGIICIGVLSFVIVGLSPFKLYMNGVETVAVVIAPPTSNSTVKYQFEADGRKYIGGGSVGPVKGLADGISKYRLGTQLKIWYLPIDPQTSSAAEPAEDVQGIIGLWIALVLALCWFVWNYKRRMAG